MVNAILTTFVVVLLAYVYFQYVANTGAGESGFSTKLQESYDYIVVGAGSAGSVLAARLSEDTGNDVLLLEAGGSDEDNPNIYKPGAAGMLMRSEEDWEYYTEPQKHACYAMKEKRSYWPRGRVLGGSSSLNWMVYMRGNRHDYDSWAADGCEGWSYKDVLPYFIKSEDVQIDELKKSEYRGKGGSLPVTGPNITPMQQYYINAGKDLGYNIIDCNGKDQIGFCWMQSTIKKGERWSAYRSFVKPNLGRSNLHVSPNSMTTKIIIKDKKAVGVECIKNGRKVQVLARKEVIVSAGAINSPQLLMLSGVGPKEHLEKFGIPVHADLPVGENLQDHFMVPLMFSTNITGPVTLDNLMSRWTQREYDFLRTGLWSATSLEGMAFVYRDLNLKKDTGKNSDIQLHTFSFHGYIPEAREAFPMNYKEEVKDKLYTVPKDLLTITFLPTILHPKSSGTIRLRSSDPFDYPAIDPHFLEHPDDVRTAIDSVKFVEALANTPALRAIGMDVNKPTPLHKLCDQHNFRSDEFWECYVRHHTLTVYHPTTTCRMGAVDDPTAVVDPQLRVKGIAGLRVADASVMRNVPAGNTNAPAIMVGEKAADLIRKGKQ